MIKNALAALAVLSLVPSAAMAVEANLAKTPTSTLTYTIRAKDTSPTDILSMGGAASCSVVASLASGSVSVVPRADASVAHSTATAGTVTLGASGPGTLTSSAGQFSVSFTAVGKSTVTVACTPGAALAAEADTTPYFTGATGDGVTNDLAALQAEIDRLALLPIEQRVLYLPAGDFVIGDKDGDLTEFYTGALQLGQIDGFKLIGAGRDITNLIAGSDQGQNIINICDLNGGTNCAPAEGGGSTMTYNTYISDLSFVDLDPIASGGQNRVVIWADAPIGATPAYGDAVTWGANSGTLIQVGADVGQGTRYVLGKYTIVDSVDGAVTPGPIADGGSETSVLEIVSYLPTPGVGQAIGSGGWIAQNVSATEGFAVEGTHGFNTKYSDGLVAERIGCRDISDECIDMHYPTTNITITDVHSTGVGSVDEGGSTIAISGADGAYISNFYVDMGDNGFEGKASAIDVATNDESNFGTSNVTKNVFISDGIIEDTSTDLGGQAQLGVKLALSGTTASLININFDNVRIDKDYVGVRAVEFNGTSGVGNGNVTFKNSHIIGTIKGPTQTTYINSWFIDNTLEGHNGGAAVSGSDANANYLGNSFYYPGTNVLLDFAFPSSSPVIVRGNTFHAGAVLDCMVVGSSLMQITANSFYDCGPSGGTFAVQMNDGSHDNSVTDNIYFDSRSAALGFYSGDGSGAGCQADAANSGSPQPTNFCDDNIIYVE